MLNGLFNSTTIPVMEQVVNFTEARQNILAGNIANLNTPGYEVQDLSVGDFQERLAHAIQCRRQPEVYRSPGEPTDPDEPTELAEVSKDPRNILYHDKSNVGLEFQVTEMVKNQIQHNMALAIMSNQFRLLQTAISERI
ncbi:MAG: flagellar basal body rod protein FlgB [Pirellulales bacterium]|nr:flagellar basal body rod protein FlgB [Pirellulales bacterium]